MSACEHAVRHVVSFVSECRNDFRSGGVHQQRIAVTMRRKNARLSSSAGRCEESRRKRDECREQITVIHAK